MIGVCIQEMTSQVIDVAAVSEFLKTKYDGVHEEYVRTFTPFILGSQTELCIDVGNHYDIFGYVTKESIKNLVQKMLAKTNPLAMDKYAILPGPRKSDKIMVSVDGLLKLLTKKNMHGWKLYKEMEGKVHDFLANPSEAVIAITSDRYKMDTPSVKPPEKTSVNERARTTTAIACEPSGSGSTRADGEDPTPSVVIEQPLHKRVDTLVPVSNSNIAPINGAHTDYTPANGIYIIDHGHCKVTGNSVVEYGQGHVADRVRVHKCENKHANPVLLASVGTSNAYPVEQTIKSIVDPFAVDIRLNKQNKKEYFACKPEMSKNLLQNIADTISRIHGHLIIRLDFGTKVLIDKTMLSASNNIDVEREKTRQAIVEKDARVLAAEYKFKAEVVKADARKVKAEYKYKAEVAKAEARKAEAEYKFKTEVAKAGGNVQEA